MKDRTITFYSVSYWAFFTVMMLHSAVGTAQINSQNTNSTKFAVQAARLCQSGDLEGAEKAIELALQSESEVNSLYTWHVKGFIEKEMYKNHESTNPQSLYRIRSVQSFLHAYQMIEEDEDTYGISRNLVYLASTYYNDVLSEAGNFEIGNEALADTLMDSYLFICHQIGVEPESMTDFYRQKGMRYYQLWNQDKCDIELNQLAFENYYAACVQMRNNCDSYYNAGVVRYTLAQYFSDTMEDTQCKTKVDKKCALREAIDILLEGEEACEDNGDIIKVLYNAYFLLGDTANARRYEKMIRE